MVKYRTETYTAIQNVDGKVTLEGTFTYVEDLLKNKDDWEHQTKNAWYTHKTTGLKVKKEVLRTDDGSYITTLTVKTPIPSERGKNPNSHNNRKIPGLVSRDVRLTEEQWQTVESLGDGKGYSQGVRNLLSRVGEL